MIYWYARVLFSTPQIETKLKTPYEMPRRITVYGALLSSKCANVI